MRMCTHARHRLVVFDVVLRQRPEREKMCVSGQRERCASEARQREDVVSKYYTQDTPNVYQTPVDGIMAPTNEVTRPTKRVCV